MAVKLYHHTLLHFRQVPIEGYRKEMILFFTLVTSKRQKTNRDDNIYKKIKIQLCINCINYGIEKPIKFMPFHQSLSGPQELK